MIQLQNQTFPTFASYASYIAYRTDNSIRIKTFNKDTREL